MPLPGSLLLLLLVAVCCVDPVLCGRRGGSLSTEGTFTMQIGTSKGKGGRGNRAGVLPPVCFVVPDIQSSVHRDDPVLMVSLRLCFPGNDEADLGEIRYNHDQQISSPLEHARKAVAIVCKTLGGDACSTAQRALEDQQVDKSVVRKEHYAARNAIGESAQTGDDQHQGDLIISLLSLLSHSPSNS